MSSPDARSEDYFKVYGPSCSYRTKPDVMSDEGLRKRLGSLKYINKPCLFDEDMLHYVRYEFQIPTSTEVRMPEKGENIYNRGGDFWQEFL